MLAQQRYTYITDQLRERGSVKVSELAGALKTSAETIRRDLIVLETKGRLTRVFGGAVSIDHAVHFESLEKRKDTNAQLKRSLSETAIQLIENGDILAVDAGSTAVIFADVLKKSFENLTIVTYSYDVFEILKDKFEVILAGGSFRKDENYFEGAFTEEFLSGLHVNKAVVFVSGITVEHGAEDYTPSMVPLQRKIMEIADRTLFLADSSKIGKRAMVKICDLSPEHIYISDSAVPAEIRRDFSENGLTLICEKL